MVYVELSQNKLQCLLMVMEEHVLLIESFWTIKERYGTEDDNTLIHKQYLLVDAFSFSLGHFMGFVDVFKYCLVFC